MDDDTYRDLASAAAADIERHRVDADLTLEAVSETRTIDVAREVSADVQLDAGAVLSLTARHPYEAGLGRIDVLWPGRWDTEGDYVSLKTMVYGPTVGQWDGSVVYASFTAPRDGRYLIIGHFSGHNCTMKLRGPWGETSSHTAVMADPGSVVATWSGSGGVSFTLISEGDAGVFRSIEILEL